MKHWVLIYYLLFLLNSCYRSYSFEYESYASIFGFFNENVYSLILFTQTGLLLLAASCALFIEKQRLHLLFFTIIFLLDLYFQNVIKFEESAILTHLIPLFIFLIAQVKDKNTVRFFMVSYLSIGYTVSAIGKIQGGWLSPQDLAIFKHYTNFNALSPNIFVSADFVKTHFNHTIWKTLDYASILFQLSAAFLLFSKRYLKYYLILAIVFHLAIAVLLQVSLFYPYIIFYGIILAYEAGENIETQPVPTVYIYRGLIIAATAIIAYIYHSGIFTHLTFTIFIYKDFCLTISCALLFLFYWIKYAIRRKRYEHLQNA